MQPRDVVITSAPAGPPLASSRASSRTFPPESWPSPPGKEAIRRAGIDINTIDEIVMGECYTAMQGSLPAQPGQPRASACPADQQRRHRQPELRLRHARAGRYVA